MATVDAIEVVAWLWVAEDRVAEFEAYEREAARVMKRCGGILERVIRSSRPQGPDQPFEVHVLQFPSLESFESYRSDPELKALAPTRQAVITKTLLLLGGKGPSYAGMALPLIERVKIQAQALIPLVKALQAELGEQRANAIVRKALGDLYRRYGEEWWRSRPSGNFGDRMATAFRTFAGGGALDYQVLTHTQDAFDVNVTGCRYAEFYKELGAPELGFLLTCSADLAMAEGYDPEVRLTRTQTIMQGASHCDFRYARKGTEPRS
jgi:uncharacterized protein (DUF1330 family)